MLKRIICFITVCLLTVFNIQAASGIEINSGNEFYVFDGVTASSDVASVLVMTEKELRNYCEQNNIVYLAVNAENTKQIQLTLTKTEFSKSTENLSKLSNQALNEIIPDLIGIEGVKGKIIEKEGQKFIKSAVKTTDSGGEYKLISYFTIAGGKEYLLSFYTSSAENTDYAQACFDSFRADDFYTSINSKSAVLKIIFIAVIVILMIAAAFIGYTVVRDLRKNKVKTLDIQKYIKEIKLFLFDMDGTLYLGDRLYDFTIELLETIKKQNKRYLFMTNNSSKSVLAYIEKLKKLGITACEEDFITSSQATALYLKENFPNDRLYVCGTKSLKDELASNGFTVTEQLDEVDCIVMGNDTELTFKKLDDISRLLSTREVHYIATNPDYVCPTEYGSVPDCGSVCDMIYNATGKRPLFIGKPEPAMPEIAMKITGYSKTETAVIGDRIYTDIKSGLNAGIKNILVMSGETTKEILEASADKPDVVLESGKEILDYLLHE